VNSETAILSVHKLDKILIPVLISPISSIIGAVYSQIVFTILAPIESQTLINKSTTAI